MYSVPPHNFIYCSYKVSVSFADDLGNHKACRGTGFFVAAGERIVFVTNRHVFDSKYKKPATHETMHLTETKILGKTRQGDTYELLVDLDQEIIYADNYENDIACLIDPKCKSTHPKAEVFYHFGIEALADDYFFSERLLPGEQVFYAGFPDPHDKLAQRPILRSGTIASDPRHPYSNSGNNEGDRVAYEAFSSPGASGSPVFAASRSFENYPGARPGAVVGVNGGHIIEAPFGAHSGISFFYRTSALLDMLSKRGIKR